MAERAARRSFFALFMRYWLPVLVYVSVILALSAQQNLRPPAQLRLPDKAYHLGEYFGLSVLLARAFRAGSSQPGPTRTLMKAVTLGVLIGVCDEIFQSFVPGRSSDPFDVLADATGILLAQIAFLLVVRD